jgi:hypothetical protein
MEQKVGREVAEAEFERMCKSRRLVTAVEEMDDDDAAGFEDLKRKIVRAIQVGDLVITDEGDPVYTPPVPGAKPLTFYKPTGATLIAMDAKGPNDSDGNQVRLARAITEMTRTAKGEVSKLEVTDYRICGALANLFLASR